MMLALSIPFHILFIRPALERMRIMHHEAAPIQSGTVGNQIIVPRFAESEALPAIHYLASVDEEELLQLLIAVVALLVDE